MARARAVQFESTPDLATVACLVIIPLFISEIYDWLIVLVISSDTIALFKSIAGFSFVMLFIYGILVSASRLAGLASASLGVILAHMVSINFRGSWVRTGTFDFFEVGNALSPWLFALPVLTGYIVGQLLQKKGRSMPELNQNTAILLGFGLVPVGFITWLIGNGSRYTNWSSFAETRHIVLIAAGLVTVAFIYIYYWRLNP